MHDFSSKEKLRKAVTSNFTIWSFVFGGRQERKRGRGRPNKWMNCVHAGPRYYLFDACSLVCPSLVANIYYQAERLKILAQLQTLITELQLSFREVIGKTCKKFLLGCADIVLPPVLASPPLAWFERSYSSFGVFSTPSTTRPNGYMTAKVDTWTMVSISSNALPDSSTTSAHLMDSYSFCDVQEQPPLPPEAFAERSFFRRKPNAHDLVNGSLASSANVLKEASLRLSGATRMGQLTMRFNHGWQDRQCEVQQWYIAQQKHAQGGNSSTKFQSIEHRRVCDAPFFHEFLLLCLADGSAYRVERTGVGSNTDAIRSIGCESRDLIEWFERSDTASMTGQKRSQIIVSVKLPSGFDVLDVLAVCYSIQREENTSKYTLQRYNCYFFCCTILSILARHAAYWESCIIKEDWDTLVENALNKISTVSQNLGNKEEEELLLLRLFSIFNPNIQEPTQSLVDALKSALLLHFETYTGAFSDLLWASDWNLAMSLHLGKNVKQAIDECCMKSSSCRLVLKPTSLGSNNEHHVKLMEKLYLQRYVAMLRRRLELKVKEGTAGPDQEVHKWMRKSSAAVEAALAVAAVAPQICATVPRYYLPAMSAVWASLRSFELEQPPDGASALDLSPVDVAKCAIPASPGNHQNSITHTVLNNIVKTEELGIPELTAILSEVHAWMTDEEADLWREHVVGACFYKALHLEAISHFDLRSPKVSVCYMTRDGLQNEEIDGYQFQSLIEGHIQCYAGRVDSYSLGLASSIVADVKSAITKVWKSLPLSREARVDVSAH
ncbi:hypothetical protein BDV93DRAFT_512905 [Ceratobasidium sp. AG-I]|nr:hypothetical protein BDV93DRAFT_512905 [Ceratobasidium sp. AG-I]